MNSFEAKYDLIVERKENGKKRPQNVRDPFSPISSPESTVMRLCHEVILCGNATYICREESLKL